MPEITGTLRPPRLASAPGSPGVGQMYYNTTDNKLYYWNGTAWVSGSAGGGAEIYEQAGTPTEPVGTGALWIDTDEQPPAWASGIPLVTSLPTSPIDGQEIYYLADATNGVIWHLRYRATSSSAYKWEFIGGPPMHTSVAAGAGVASGTYADVGGGVPALTLPALAGDYVVRFGMLMASATATTFDFKAAVKFGAAIAVDADSVSWSSPVASAVLEAANIMREFVKTGLAASIVLKHQYKDTSVGQAVFYDRFISVLPVRVG